MTDAMGSRRQESPEKGWRAALPLRWPWSGLPGPRHFRLGAVLRPACVACVCLSPSPPSLLQRLLLCRQLGDSSGEGPEFVEEE